MSNADDYYDNFSIADVTYQAVIPDTVFPETTQNWTAEGFSDTARVVQACDAFTQQLYDATRNLPVA
jgi:hypothetical protein